MTRDGTAVSLMLNAGLLSDMPHLDAVGADGIGLYRTEIAFLSHRDFLSEEDQVTRYQRVVEAARRTGRKVVVGYILRHHPSWVRLITEARALGGPYVFRLNLNQQSSGPTWAVHKALIGG